MLDVRHLGDLRYSIASESDPPTRYDVDLSTPTEACTCPRFWFVHSPAILKGGKLQDNNCKHIRAAWQHQAHERIKRMV